MYLSPPMMLMVWVGAMMMRRASLASTLRILTLSSIATPALARMLPSMRRMPLPVSPGWPGQTMAEATCLPSISITSPLTRPIFFMVSMSTREMPRPASWW